MIIYKITNLLDQKIYVGQTQQTLEKRVEQHKHTKNSYIGRAIQKYGLENFKAEIIEECHSVEELNEREIFWIKELKSMVPNGYNVTEGGRGSLGHSPSSETREKISKSSKGRKLSPETCKKISDAKKGHEVSAETRKKISESKKNPSPETIKKLSDSHKGKEVTPETRKKLSDAMNKYYEDPANRARVSEQSKGRKCSEEKKAKISAANKGHEVTPETRKKISDANHKPGANEHRSQALKKYYQEHPEARKAKSDYAKRQWQFRRESQNNSAANIT